MKRRNTQIAIAHHEAGHCVARVRLGLMGEIARQKGIGIADEDIEKGYLEMAEQTGPESPADVKYAPQSIPGAFSANSARFHRLFCLNVSAASESGAKAPAIPTSREKTSAARLSVSATLANFSTLAI